MVLRVHSPARPPGARGIRAALPADGSQLFENPIAPGPAIFASATRITWNGDDRKAVKDIAALGFAGIQCVRSRCGI